MKKRWGFSFLLEEWNQRESMFYADEKEGVPGGRDEDRTSGQAV